MAYTIYMHIAHSDNMHTYTISRTFVLSINRGIQRLWLYKQLFSKQAILVETNTPFRTPFIHPIMRNYSINYIIAH